MPTEIPSVVSNWADGVGAQNTEPAAGIKSQGFVGGEHPPAQFLNWILGNNSEWATYLSELSAALQLQGFEVSAQTVPDDTVAIKAGRVLGNDDAIDVSADAAFTGFSDRHATLSRIDLIYIQADGTIAIAEGTPNATPANGRQAYGGRYVIAEVTIVFNAAVGPPVIQSGDIRDVRSIQATRSAVWADFAGTFLNAGGASPHITFASVTDGGEALIMAINGEAGGYTNAPPTLPGDSTRFDAAKGSVLIRKVISATSNAIDVYYSTAVAFPRALTRMLRLGEVAGVWTMEIWDGSGQQNIATEAYVDNAVNIQMATATSASTADGVEVTTSITGIPNDSHILGWGVDEVITDFEILGFKAESDNQHTATAPQLRLRNVSGITKTFALWVNYLSY